jgi:1-acyl-sn-glycerol-3-phosphate acyltransferase
LLLDTAIPSRSSLLFGAARALVGSALRLAFRRIDVHGQATIPQRGPLLVVANHHNGGVDPALIGVHLGRPLRLTAKSTLQKVPLLDRVLRAFDVIPIHRQRDLAEGADPSCNGRSLEAIVDSLSAGAAIALFPEGISHDGPGLLRFKHGAAHVALAAARRQPDGPVWVLPCAIGYSAKSRLRGVATLRFGQPLDAARWLAEHPQASPGDLTAVLRNDVAHLLPRPTDERTSDGPWRRGVRMAGLLAGLPALACLGPALLASAWLTRRMSPDRHSDPSWQVLSLAAFMPLSTILGMGGLWLTGGWPAAITAAGLLPLSWPALLLGMDALFELGPRGRSPRLGALTRSLALSLRKHHLARSLRVQPTNAE